MTTDDAPRPGSSVDLSKRMDRMEQKHDALATEVAGLTGTVARVEMNQAHAEELNKLRFGSLDQAIALVSTNLVAVGGKLDGFMTRIEGIFTGEVQLPRNEALFTDYKAWRVSVDAAIEEQTELATQVKFLGRIVVFLGTGLIATFVALLKALGVF